MGRGAKSEAHRGPSITCLGLGSISCHSLLALGLELQALVTGRQSQVPTPTPLLDLLGPSAFSSSAACLCPTLPAHPTDSLFFRSQLQRVSGPHISPHISPDPTNMQPSNANPKRDRQPHRQPQGSKNARGWGVDSLLRIDNAPSQQYTPKANKGGLGRVLTQNPGFDSQHCTQPGLAVHACNSSTQRSRTSQAPGYPRLHVEFEARLGSMRPCPQRTKVKLNADKWSIWAV